MYEQQMITGLIVGAICGAMVGAIIGIFTAAALRLAAESDNRTYDFPPPMSRGLE
jgi:hypothetical protein